MLCLNNGIVVVEWNCWHLSDRIAESQRQICACLSNAHAESNLLRPTLRSSSSSSWETLIKRKIENTIRYWRHELFFLIISASSTWKFSFLHHFGNSAESEKRSTHTKLEGEEENGGIGVIAVAHQIIRSNKKRERKRNKKRKETRT